jgi:hypothetical protein
VSARSATVLRLAALPVGEPARATLYASLRTTTSPCAASVVAAKFRDYRRRGFLTTEDWQTARLTDRGRQMLGRLP